MSVNMHCCLNCADRQRLCSVSCEKYAQMRAVRDKMREEARKDSEQRGHIKRAMQNFRRFHHEAKERRK